VLAHEVDRLLRRVAAVRGVKRVENMLDVHAEPGDIPALQGRPRTPRGGEVLDFMQNNWSPTTRFFSGAAAAACIAWGLRRFDALGLTVTVVGLGLLSRAIANIPVSRLAGAELPRRVARR
jgi:hypothetical protein